MDRLNTEIADMATDIAWGALKSWHQARDIDPAMSRDDCRELAETALTARPTTPTDDGEYCTDVLARCILKIYGFASVDPDFETIEKI
jgi:hypothetical protein